MTFTLLDIPVLFGISIEVYVILTVIIVSTFFFWRWLFKKFIKPNRNRKIATWTATFLLTPVIYVGLIILLMYSMTYTPSKDFDKPLWQTDTEGRFQMADDIIKSKMLISKDTIQVKQILGEPTWGSDNTWRADKINTWTYDMGFGSGMVFLFHNLVIKFYKGKVIEVDHVKKT